MRIGTWNLDGRWTSEHHGLIQRQDCDVWLLTEVNAGVVLTGYQGHVTVHEMAPQRRWAGVYSRTGLQALPDPHPAGAMATVDGITFCSPILPWRSCGTTEPWVGDNHDQRVTSTLDQLRPQLPQRDLVWGGDWNQGFVGREYVGSRVGRASLHDLVDHLSLVIATAELPSQCDGSVTIDHIALPKDTTASQPTRINAAGLSDHDMYVVDVSRTETPPK